MVEKKTNLVPHDPRRPPRSWQGILFLWFLLHFFSELPVLSFAIADTFIALPNSDKLSIFVLLGCDPRRAHDQEEMVVKLNLVLSNFVLNVILLMKAL
jgi:hypothetical protein